MIGISFNQKEFEYDAYTLLKAVFSKRRGSDVLCTGGGSTR